MVLYLHPDNSFFFFLRVTSNYLKRETSAVSEFKLKQLKRSSREEFLLSRSLPYNSLSSNKQAGGLLDVVHRARGVVGGVISGEGCSCCTGQATKLLKKVVR